MVRLGHIWLDNLGKQRRYVQQYDPFTGEADAGAQGYGPTMLAALEYIAMLYGVVYRGERALLCACGGRDSTSYTQRIGERTIVWNGKWHDACILGRKSNLHRGLRAVRGDFHAGGGSVGEADSMRKNGMLLQGEAVIGFLLFASSFFNLPPFLHAACQNRRKISRITH